MIARIKTGTVRTLRLALLAVGLTLIVIGFLFSSPPVQAGERTLFEFDYTSPESLREYFARVGFLWVSCDEAELELGMAILPNGRAKMVCMTPAELNEIAFMKACALLSAILKKPLVLGGSDDRRFWCELAPPTEEKAAEPEPEPGQ